MMTEQQRLALKTIQDNRAALVAQGDEIQAEFKTIQKAAQAMGDLAGVLVRHKMGGTWLDLCAELIAGGSYRLMYTRQREFDETWDRIDELDEKAEAIKREAAARERKPWRPDKEAKKPRKGKGRK